MDVVAEGVETEGQRARLTDMECEFGQGYYFSKPMGEDDVEAFLFNRLPPTGPEPQGASRSTTVVVGAMSAAPRYVNNEI
jgi:predicted signal transduction protein with EAL and GGDEF domain